MNIFPTRKRTLIAAAALFVVAAGISAWLWISWKQVDPLRTYRSQPRFERAVWHDDEAASLLRRLDRLTRKRDWNEDDAAFIRGLIEMGVEDIEPMSPRTLAVAPVGIRDMAGAPRELSEAEQILAEPPLPAFPPPGDLHAELEWFASTPEGREMARWFDMYNAVTIAEPLIWDRLRQGIPVPESLQRFAVERWTAMLSETDPRTRSRGAGALIQSHFSEDPSIRVLVEAIRYGDPDAGVRA